jgi:hypothetical protein
MIMLHPPVQGKDDHLTGINLTAHINFCSKHGEIPTGIHCPAGERSATSPEGTCHQETHSNEDALQRPDQTVYYHFGESLGVHAACRETSMTYSDPFYFFYDVWINLQGSHQTDMYPTTYGP